MIFKGSRYEGVPVYRVTDATGGTFTALRIRLVPKTPAGFFHTFTAGERLDLLAHRYYRNPEKFWRIADANAEMDPEDLLVPGRLVRIPPDRT